MAIFPMARLFATLGVPGPDLLLRPYGRRAFPILKEELVQTSPGQSLVLNFEGVSVMDTSFADETVLELAIRLSDGQYGDRFLILEKPSSATIDNIEGTIARRKVKIGFPAQEEGRMWLIGNIEPNLAETWQLTLQAGTLTARDLANRLGLEINTASTRLHKLYKARLLARREEVIPSGRQHIYEVPQ